MRCHPGVRGQQFDLVICMTGAGLTFLRDLVAPYASVARLGAALSRVTIVSRGDKLQGVRLDSDLRRFKPNIAIGTPRTEPIAAQANSRRSTIGVETTRLSRTYSVSSYRPKDNGVYIEQENTA